MGGNVKGAFVKQAAILAIAGLIVRFIGFLYRLPLTNMIGDEGNTIYAVGYNIYTFILIVSSAGLPAAISKMVSERIALKKFNDAHNVFIVSMITAFFTGGIGAIILGLFAMPISTYFGTPEGYYALLSLSPTILVVAIMAVFRGYFQGMSTMVPTAISQIVEQIFNATFSILLAYLLFANGVNFAAAGGTAGTGIGAIAGLIFLTFAYLLAKPMIKGRCIKDKNTKKEPLFTIFKILIRTAIPIIIGTAIFAFTNLIDMKMVLSLLVKNSAFTYDQAKILYGQLTGKYVVLTTLPVAIATALGTAVLPNIASSVILGDHDAVKRKISIALRITMILSIPSAVGMGILSDGILFMLFPKYHEGGGLLTLGSVAIVFLALAQICTGILQGIGKTYVPAVSALVGVTFKIIINFILISNPKINIYGAIISTIVCYFIASIIDFIVMCVSTKFIPNLVDVFFKPLFASIIMGCCCYVTYSVCVMASIGNTIAVLLSITLGLIAYSGFMLFIKGFYKEDISILPMGNKILKKLELYGFI